MNLRRASSTVNRLRLGIGATCVAGIWLVALPQAATIPAVRDHLLHLDEYDVNAGAMYYTELKAMPRILEKLERRGIDLSDGARRR